MFGHPGTPKTLEQVYLFYGKSGFICVVRHGFQQNHWKGAEHTLHEADQWPFQRWPALFTILGNPAESSLHPAQPPPQRPSARLREGGGRREGEGIFTAGRPAGGAEEGSRPAQEEPRGEGRPRSPSLPLKTSLVSITSD